MPGVRPTPESAKQEPGGDNRPRRAERDDCEAIHRLMSGPRDRGHAAVALPVRTMAKACSQYLTDILPYRIAWCSRELGRWPRGLYFLWRPKKP